MKKLLLTLSIFSLLVFTYFSYIVAKERWTKIDFDTTVKIQDKIPKRFDDNLSLFSLLGSAEVTIGICIIMAFFALIRFKWLHILGWAMIVPATLAEVFGKYVLYHPGPPVFFHRTTISTHLPSFYVHTDFSYPSGHVTRTIFVITILFCIVFVSKLNLMLKVGILSSLFTVAFLMMMTRISLGEHWLSDVLGGMFLGMGTGLFSSVLILSKKKG